MGNQLQHYVPRFSLRQFGKGKKDHVQVVTGKPPAPFP